jgi:hypothetical protein
MVFNVSKAVQSILFNDLFNTLFNEKLFLIYIAYKQ